MSSLLKRFSIKCQAKDRASLQRQCVKIIFRTCINFRLACDMDRLPKARPRHGYHTRPMALDIVRLLSLLNEHAHLFAKQIKNRDLHFTRVQQIVEGLGRF